MSGKASLALSNEEILAQFKGYKQFDKYYPNWSEELKILFFDFIRLCHEQNLDIFIVKGNGHDIRMGRKALERESADAIFTTIQLWTDKITFGQRFKYQPDHIYGDLDQSKLIDFKNSGDFAEFKEQFPFSRNPYLPLDYGNIWKVSHSPSTFSNEALAWLEQNRIVTVHENTGNGSARAFKEISQGDIVSLSYGGKVYLIVRITSDIKFIDGPHLNNEWMMRSYDVIKKLEKPKQYEGNPKRWSPSFNGTSWKVPKDEFWMFEEEILKPYYGLSLEDLGFNTSIISKPEINRISSERMNKVPLNQILYGPPGTGKTYHSIQAAVKAAEPEAYNKLGINEELGTTQEQREELTQLYKGLFDAGRIRFVTFHQSYGYEEFVEGLSAKTEGDSLSYFEKAGVFKDLCKKAKSNFDDSQKSEAELTDSQKFNEALESFKLAMFDESDAFELTEAVSITAIENSGFRYGGESWKSSQIMKYEDLKSLYLEGVDNRQGIKISESVSGLAKQHASYFIRALEAIKSHLPQVTANSVVSEKKNYVLIVDEINRGNISKIFGELITLIEPSKRFGQSEAIEVTLPYSGDKFSVPDNLYIIGTMNTADRSLALMDTALRRRFDFVEMMPDYNVLRDEKGWSYYIDSEDNEIDLALLLETMNNRISALYDREHQLGHAFLMPVIKAIVAGENDKALNELKSCFQNKIIPLLAEYFFEDWQKIRLVLGDNQKPKAYQLIEQSDVDYEKLFGETDDVGDYAEEVKDYNLIDADSELWLDALTYIGIYKASDLPKDEG